MPVEDIKRFMAEKPNVRGLAVPGMPAESPGMENGRKAEAFKVLAFKGDVTWIEFQATARRLAAKVTCG